jgi:hypothetical protein
MSDEEVLNFKANDKELQLFEQEKMDLYKGTFVVCLVYGLSAVLLLALVLFTDWGKDFIYDKFAPAVITYVFGSLIIIIYLLYSIYTIKPRRIGKDIDNDNNIKCPDFWKLKKTSDDAKFAMININKISPALTDINDTQNTNLQYYCEYDEAVYGNKRDFLNMKKELGNNFYGGYKTLSEAKTNEVSKTAIPEYIVKLPTYDSNNIGFELKKYARFTGAYGGTKTPATGKLDDTTTDTYKSSIPKVAFSSYYGSSGDGSTADNTLYTNYENNAPLVCNKVYPQVLGILDNKQKKGNEVSCEYAKQCDISWSSLNCN